MAIERQNYRSAGYVEARSRANKSPSRSSKSRNTTSAGNQNTGNAREDYISNYVSKGIVKGGGTKKAGGGYHDATVSGDRGRSSARETQQAINNAAAIAAAQKAKRKAKNKNITKFGYNKPQSGGINGLIRLLIGSVHPAAGLLMGGFDKLKGGLGSLNDKLGDFREKTTGFRTQQEWEDARQDRIDRKRINTIQNTLNKKYPDGDYSNTQLDERLAGLQEKLGISPTAQNVLTGRDLKGFTESRGLQIPISNKVVDTPNVPMGTPWDNPYEAPMGTPWDNPYKAPDSPEWTSWEVPPGMMNDAYQDNLKFFDNLNKGIVENNEPPMVNTDNVMQGSVLDATPKKGIMESISDWFSSSQQPETIVEDNVPVSNYDVRPDFYPGNKYQNTTIDNGLISIDEGVWAPKPGEWGYRGPLRLAEGGLASMFTRRG